MKTKIAIIILLSSVVNSIYAQEFDQATIDANRNKSISVIKAATPPIIDGIMDPIWQDATVIEDLHQTEPIAYGEPSEKTVIRIFYDENFLYVSSEMHYRDPSIIIANKLIQGANIRDDDRLRVYINPFNDGRNGYIFQTNANGVRSEGIIENVLDRNFDWTGIWYTKARFTDYGWFTEMAIPYKTISFNPNSSTWGISFQRNIRGKNEDLAWTSNDREIEPPSFGTVSGLVGLQQGVGLDLIPGIALTSSRAYQPIRESDSNFDPSLDVFYKFSPNLTGALTFNSDFSATDVDARQVQLSRFSLFFPEQRKFFLQEADIFEFGGLENNGKPFFSRRIGLGPGDQTLDVEAGGKLTGRIGNYNVGALIVRQGDNAGLVDNEDDLIDSSDLFVGRVAANVFGESKLGFITTYGNPRGDEDNSLIGADFNYIDTRRFGRTVDAEIWYQKTDSEGLDGDDDAFGAQLKLPSSQGINGELSYLQIADNFNPALGFVNRGNIKQIESEISYISRFSSDSWILTTESGIGYSRISDIDGNVESEELDIELVELETRTEEVYSLNYFDIREVLFEPFEIADGVVIPVGDYSFKRYGAEIETAQQRTVAAVIEFEGGEFYGGDLTTYALGLGWQPNRNFYGLLEFEYNDIKLPQGEFSTRLLRLETEVAFNLEWSWINNIQYDNQSDSLGVNSRLQWIPKAGQEFYLIYNGGWLDDEIDGFEKVGQSATIKLNYTIRF
ncbi:MAG: carbohydrate binding family 9 domain-containing protein [Acidiferrobacterales bacterium]|nr:carbohydrate binding family 9 domain-containing protein [Acidiferrobacterales bacterium]